MAPASAASLLPKPEITTIRLGNNAHEADSFATEYARQLGIYKLYGFKKVTSTYFDGDAKGRQALLANQIDLMSGSPASAIEYLTTNTHILQIGMFIDKPTDDLVSVASIKNAAELKGKKVGISQFGSDAHASVLLGLKAVGLKQSDVTIVQVGGDSKRLAALKAGAIQAAPVDQSQEKQMAALGFHILTRLSSAPTTLARESIMVRADFAKKYPNATLDLLAANMAALHDEYVDPSAAAPGYHKWVGTGTPALALHQVQLYLALGLQNMESPPDAWNNMKEVMATANPKIKSVNVADAYSKQYLDKLKAIGFEKAIGVPGA
ncbi:MAG: ABC transporter substrate-binding protein [Chloroflexota bacterium]